MVYITGDTHRDFDRFYRFCEIMDTTKKDIMIILGDAGINYFVDDRDDDYMFESEQPDDEFKKRQFQTSWSLNGGSLVIIMASGRQGSSGCYITI